jgi:hypothetical protein
MFFAVNKRRRRRKQCYTAQWYSGCDAGALSNFSLGGICGNRFTLGWKIVKQ